MAVPLYVSELINRLHLLIFIELIFPVLTKQTRAITIILFKQGLGIPQGLSLHSYLTYLTVGSNFHQIFHLFTFSRLVSTSSLRP